MLIISLLNQQKPLLFTYNIIGRRTWTPHGRGRPGRGGPGGRGQPSKQEPGRGGGGGGRGQMWGGGRGFGKQSGKGKFGYDRFRRYDRKMDRVSSLAVESDWVSNYTY